MQVSVSGSNQQGAMDQLPRIACVQDGVVQHKDDAQAVRNKLRTLVPANVSVQPPQPGRQIGFVPVVLLDNHCLGVVCGPQTLPMLGTGAVPSRKDQASYWGKVIHGLRRASLFSAACKRSN